MDIAMQYIRIKRYCISKWNGNGMDVFQEAMAIALERYGDLENVNFSLLKRICSEAARNLKVYRFYQDIENVVIPVIPVIPDDIEPEEPETESFVHVMDIETKKAYLEKIKQMKRSGYRDEEIVQMLSSSSKAFAEKIKKQKETQQPIQKLLF